MRAFNQIVAAFVAVLLAMFSGVAFADDDDDDDDDSKPRVVVLAAAALTPESAQLRGEVDPRDRATTYAFHYGPTTAYGLQTPSGDAGDDDEWRSVSVAVAGLEPGITYHYRLVARNSRGTTVSEDRTFTTPRAAPAVSPESGPPTPPAEDGAPPAEDAGEPEVAERVVVEPTGEILVRRPGGSDFVPLAAGSDLPVGSVVDARGGSVALTAALPTGETQTGRFGGGRFLIRQGSSGRVDLHLRGSYCPRQSARASAVAAGARKRRRGRRLWGRDKGGKFRTHGNHSHATVRGTRWVVADRCDGTLTRVTEGSVVVRDKVRRKRVIVRVGESYLARPRS